MTDYKITPNFWLSEFTRSTTAERNEIDNTPPEWARLNLRRNAEGMEEVRVLLGHVRINVHSGYRCEALERLIAWKGFTAWCARHGRVVNEESWGAYFANKDHPKGLATDFTAPDHGTPLEICHTIARSGIAFYKLIFEHTWVHIAWPALGERAERIIMTASGKDFHHGLPDA